ncbi:hypothetical protein CDL12_11499 [Handroanthus impetiginosus]|uniref:Uncharacterized protein n=1 Tax=Handroanthus impetiginosus TaxID=429701 RepID=A0A2G9HE96_9LAMI|nr:hypothetical protein CDL12_11499 [Handroanthus impetiginosus]
MGNGYDHHSINHHQHYFHQKTIFLPLFCRLSIKDIKLNNRHRDPKSADDEPSSPKVSCMGQVKRNNRVIGFPPATAMATQHHRYSKLKKLFSSKTLLPPASSSFSTTTPCSAAAGGGRSGSKSCRISREMCVNNSRRFKMKYDKCERDCVKVVVNIGELDPPLPVVKKVAPPGVGRDEVNLWKRRFNGAAALKSLHIERIQLPNSTNSLPPTV